MSTPRRLGWSGCGECLRPAWELSIVYNHEDQLQNKQTNKQTACPSVLILIHSKMNKVTLEVRFYRSDNGTEPVRDWLRGLSKVRIHLQDRIARVLFTVQDSMIVLLHGFIKKSQATPKTELQLAKKRIKGT